MAVVRGLVPGVAYKNTPVQSHSNVVLSVVRGVAALVTYCYTPGYIQEKRHSAVKSVIRCLVRRITYRDTSGYIHVKNNKHVMFVAEMWGM